MQSYIKTISNLTYQIKNQNSDDSWDEGLSNLNDWINSKNKHDVEHYYNDFLFGVVYTNRLYKSRVNCFYEVLKTLQQITGVEEILKNSEEVTSFGCGPGPEIAAYICFIRKDLKCYNNKLSITAVDQLNYWNVFINAVADLDEYATVEFKKATLNMKYLQTMNNSDVCIMSYPHAVNFENIWSFLKTKFHLVVVIDQAKKVLLDNAIINGYNIMNFECVGNKKFFYYINHSFSSSRSYSWNGNGQMDYYKPYTSMKLCPRNLHKIDYYSTNCNELIDKFINCGHVIKIKCSQYYIDNQCTYQISKKCSRNLHEKEIICGKSFVCEEIIKLRLPCDHYSTLKCCEKNTTCEKMVEFLLNCNHKKLITCEVNELLKVNRNLDLSTYVKCSVMVNKKLKCGHIQFIKCHQINDIIECTKIIIKACDRNIHQKNVICSEKFICEETSTHTFDCGHKSVLTCYKIGYYMANKYSCSVLIPYKLLCGHSQMVECCNYKSLDKIVCEESIMKVCNRNLHKHKVTCGKSIKCYEPIPFTLKCHHTIMLKCCENLNNITPYDCQIIVTKTCERQIHKLNIACHKNIVCEEMCSKTLKCGHTMMVKCNQYNINHGEYCERYFTQQCDNNLHESSIKCGSVFKCSKNVGLTLFCGHQKKFICNNIDYEKKYAIECDIVKECGHRCSVKCVCQIIGYQAIVKDSVTDNDVEESKALCGHSNNKLCEEICNHLLICGHQCKQLCSKCLNGRLHGKCLEKCVKRLLCGHQCKDFCHQDNCFNCIELCFVDKLQMFSIFNHHNYKKIEAQWTEIILIINKKSSTKILIYFNNILMNLKKSKSSKQWLDCYLNSLNFVRKVMNFYNFVLSVDFPDFLSPYIDCVKENVSHLLEWLDPINRNLSRATNNDFRLEFKRLKVIYFLCTISLSANKAGELEDVKKYDELLKELMEIKFNKNSNSKVVDKINSIFIKL